MLSSSFLKSLLLKSLFVSTSSLIFIVSLFSASSIANSNNQTNSTRQGLPGRRISGGVREGNCFKDFNQSLVAIMPRNNLGKTVSARPTFWFSVPATEGETRAEFQLFDSADEIAYSTFVNIGEEQGISEFKLPDDIPELTVDETYRWTFSLGCTDTSQFVVQGWIQRSDMPGSMVQQLEDASSEERAALYSSAGFWYEQVTELMSLRRNVPTSADFQMEWAELLATAGLTSHVSSNITEAMSAMESYPVLRGY